VAVVDQEAFFEIGLPGVGVGGVEERARVCDVCERVVALFFGDGVGEMARRVYGAVEDVDDAVAYFLAAEVGCEDCCDVGVVGEAGVVGLVGGSVWVESMVCTHGSTFSPPLCVITTVLAQLSATVFARAVPFQSTSRLSRSAPSVAQVFKKTRQTSGAGYTGSLLRCQHATIEVQGGDTNRSPLAVITVLLSTYCTSASSCSALRLMASRGVTTYESLPVPEPPPDAKTPNS